MSEYLSQTDLGKLFGVSSHAIGRWLVEIGLRTKDKRPSEAALEGGYCKLISTGHGIGTFFIWHVEKTLAALERAGYRRKDVEPPTPTAPTLVGPFEARSSSENGFEIADANGNVGIWIYGKENATPLVKVLNLASKSGFCF